MTVPRPWPGCGPNTGGSPWGFTFCSSAPDGPGRRLPITRSGSGNGTRACSAISFTRRSLADDFSLYVHRPTATDASFAPEGCDSFYVLCPVPNLAGGQDWSVEGPKLRDRIVKALDATMLPGLTDHITAEFAMTPEDFKSDYLSVDGAGFSLSPFFSQSAWFRFHNRAEGVEGLYFVGAGTHPGAGLPGVVSSAKVLDSLVPAVAPAEMPANEPRRRDAPPCAQLRPRGAAAGGGDRGRIARLYALCRTVDDMADVIGGPEVGLRLARLAQELENARTDEPLARDAQALFAGRPEGLAAFRHLVETVAQDTGDTQIADDAALDAYCHGVAGTVGLMIVALFDIGPRWHAAAADLGHAMQLTNICRDVLADAEAGRRYLPATRCPHPPSVMRAQRAGVRTWSRMSGPRLTVCCRGQTRFTPRAARGCRACRFGFDWRWRRLQECMQGSEMSCAGAIAILAGPRLRAGASEGPACLCRARFGVLACGRQMALGPPCSNLMSISRYSAAVAPG